MKKNNRQSNQTRFLWILGFGAVWLIIWLVLQLGRKPAILIEHSDFEVRNQQSEIISQKESQNKLKGEVGVSPSNFKATPLEGQMSSTEYFTTLSEGYSSWWCGGDSGGKDVLGYKLGGKHACVMRNICMMGDIPTLFVPPEANKSIPKKRIFSGLPSVVFRNVGNVVIDSSPTSAEVLKNSRDEGKFHKGLTAIIGSSYGQSHITHFMEPLGELFQFLNEFGYYSDHRGDGGYLSPPLSTTDLIGSTQVAVDRNNFNRTDFALENALLSRVLVIGSSPHTPNKGSFVEAYYRMLATNRAFPEEDGDGLVAKSPTFIGSPSKFQGQCFEEVIMVGASYNPYQFVHAPSFYRHRDWYQKVKGIIAPSAEGRENNLVKIGQPVMQPSAEAVKAIANAVERITSQRPIRNVLIAHRSRKRRVANDEEFNRWMAETLPQLLPQWEWRIRPVNFGGLTSAQQVQLANWADILVGIHGADLTNLINMKPWSVVIELNMFFFFEPRFNAMSRSLQLHYLTWTCTRPSCTKVFKSVANLPNHKDWSYDIDTEEVLISPDKAAKYKGNEAIQYEYHMELHKETGGKFRWPFYGAYDVEGCVACNLLTCCTSMHYTLYGVQRESDIIFTAKEFEEMRFVMEKAATKATTQYIAQPIESITEKLAILKAANK